MKVNERFNAGLLVDSLGWQTFRSQNITITRSSMTHGSSWKQKTNFNNNLESIREDKKQIHDGFQQSTAPFFLLAQLFGLLPVKFILRDNSNQLKFEWISFRVLHSIFMVVAVGSLSLSCFMHLFQSHFMYWKIIHTLFNAFSLVSLIWYFQLALKWPKIMKKWCEVEKKSKRSNLRSNRNRTTIRSVAFVFLFFSLMEHILSLIDAVKEAPTCGGQWSFFHAFMWQSAPMVFHFFPFSLSFAIFIKIGQTAATFIWWFNDLFIILLSVGLSSMFQEIYGELRAQREVIVDTNQKRTIII